MLKNTDNTSSLLLSSSAMGTGAAQKDGLHYTTAALNTPTGVKSEMLLRSHLVYLSHCLAVGVQSRAPSYPGIRRLRANRWTRFSPRSPPPRSDVDVLLEKQLFFLEWMRLAVCYLQTLLCNHRGESRPGLNSDLVPPLPLRRREHGALCLLHVQ